MSLWVVDGAVLMCTMGATPSQLGVPPRLMSKVEAKPKATVMDHKPNTNIRPFGLCISPANPQVASATAAAMGVLTPQPCQPATMSPWVPGNTVVRIEAELGLDDTCKCTCNWAGVISVVFAGQTLNLVP